MSDHVSSLRATAHPLRLQMLSLLTATELSAAEVARELDLTHANASYHLRVLLDAGLVVEAGEEKIRGGVAKRYRHPWRDEDRTDTGGPATKEDRELYLQAMAERMAARARERGEGRSVFTDAELWVTPEVYERVMALLLEASSLLHGEAQPPRTADTRRSNLTIALFPMSQGETR